MIAGLGRKAKMSVITQKACELNKGQGSREKEVKCLREKSVGFGNWVQFKMT